MAGMSHRWDWLRETSRRLGVGGVLAATAAAAALALLPAEGQAATPSPATLLSLNPPGPFDFGKVPIGLTHVQDFTVTYSGSVAGLTTTARVDGASGVYANSGFSYKGCSGATVPSCVFQVSWMALDTGRYSGTLHVEVSDSAHSIVQFAVTGTGQNPPTVSPTSLTFTAGATDFQPVNVTLNGAHITAINFTGGFYSDPTVQPSDCTTVPPYPADPCQVRVGAPSPARAGSGTLAVVTDDGTLVVSLQLVPPAPAIVAGPQPLPRGAPWGLNGSGFPPDAAVTILWDGVDSHQPITTDAAGAFSWTMGVPEGASNNPHQLCAVAGQARACITVTVEQLASAGGSSPSPSPSPVPPASPASSSPTPAESPSPTPSESPSPTATAAPQSYTPPSPNATLAAAVTRPPWVFVTIAVVLAALGFLAWFAWQRALRD